jgi:hypothetical protein
VAAIAALLVAMTVLCTVGSGWIACSNVTRDGGVRALRGAIQRGNVSEVLRLVDECGVSTEREWDMRFDPTGALDTAMQVRSVPIADLLLDR